MAVRDEVGFFQAVRAGIVKNTGGDGGPRTQEESRPLSAQDSPFVFDSRVEAGPAGGCAIRHAALLPKLVVNEEPSS